jgi:long-chain fatty acid transport protein
MEDFSYNSTDELGLHRAFRFDLDYPLIASIGASYTGVENLLIALDVRYIDWANADGFGSGPGFAPSGALTGFGWKSIWTVGVGAQYRLKEGIHVRAGYAFNENPITDARAGFNVGAPLVLQHFLSAGLSMQLTKALTLHAGYMYSPEVRVSGPLQGPAGPIPGSNVNYGVSAHALNVGATVAF